MSKYNILLILLLLSFLMANNVAAHEGEHKTRNATDAYIPEWCMNESAGYQETLEDGSVVCHITATENSFLYSSTSTTTDAVGVEKVNNDVTGITGIIIISIIVGLIGLKIWLEQRK